MITNAYDVWLVAANRVYEAVPYSVLADWLQQGRITESDRVRASGQTDWQLVSEVSALGVYLPQAMPASPEDRTEALQPVDLGFSVHHRRTIEDEDVDMVPLIDISLVLLIFFMMTTTVAVAGSRVQVPETQYATLTSERGHLWIGLDLGPDGQPTYAFAVGDSPPAPEDKAISADAVIERVRTRLKNRESGQTVNVRVAAHHKLPIETVQAFTNRLSALRREGLAEIKAEVQEKPK